MNNWDETKKRILNLLEEEGKHNGVNFNGKTGLFTIKFSKGVSLSFNNDQLKELKL